MEELGIGRPSTYASIVTTIQDHMSAKKKNRPIPETKGAWSQHSDQFLPNTRRVMTILHHGELDHVSAGETD
jgi:DNA topoisomerase-1